ncbi:ATP-dependent exonuclease [Neisseria shayeganii]|uniref:ATP-dependent exonuclease n=1 Tax=Neisseria shayeganii TaxID=607712 RepID=UPI000A075C84|nr:ATP-dependent exonuclease [Neisseria shayeganii]
MVSDIFIAFWLNFPVSLYGLRPLHPPHLRRISALCAAHSLAYLYDMSVPRGFLAFTLAALLRLELHPHLRVLQRSQLA